MRVRCAEAPLDGSGFLINFELSDLLSEVVYATDMAKNGRPYKNNNNMMGAGATTSFFGGALGGECRLGAPARLSPPPHARPPRPLLLRRRTAPVSSNGKQRA